LQYIYHCIYRVLIAARFLIEEIPVHLQQPNLKNASVEIAAISFGRRHSQWRKNKYMWQAQKMNPEKVVFLLLTTEKEVGPKAAANREAEKRGWAKNGPSKYRPPKRWQI
jgi:hypothetical protein